MTSIVARIRNSSLEARPYAVERELNSLFTKSEFKFVKGAEWCNMPAQLKEDYVQQAFYYWRLRGFPYYQMEENQIQHQFQQLVNVSSAKMFLSNGEIQWSNVGLALANYFHPQMWSIKSDGYLSPVECFQDDKLLKACITRALQIWPSRYGTNASNMRRILSSFTNTKRVSNFRPTVAKAIYQRYSPEWGQVLDFSAGFGGRLLGCLSLKRHYVGYEPSQDQFLGLQRTFRAIRELKLTSCEVNLQAVCAEDAICKEASQSYDLVFTSPPYFNRERYSSHDNQSYLRYKDYPTWREHFLHQLIAESWRVLHKGGILVLNVANIENAPIADDARTLAMSYFDLVKIYRLRLGQLPYRPNASMGAYHYEPVFVFTRQR